MIYIRTDANDNIATGHVMRCLTIAEEVVSLGEKVIFVVSDDNSVSLIRERGFEYVVTGSDWSNVCANYEFQMLCQYIQSNDVLLVDSYYINNDYLDCFNKICKVATFDDMFAEKKHANVIINYNIFYNIFDYAGRYKGTDSNILLGEKYVPLRRQFREVQPLETTRECYNPTVLLMCGGGDINNFICSCIKYICANNARLFNYIEWKIVIGNFYPHEQELMNFTSGKSNIKVLKNVSDMAKLMGECDICITAASTVLYECCAMLLPTIFVVTAKDQIYDAEAFSNKGMIYCGSFFEISVITLSNVLNELNELVYNVKKQQRKKDKMKNVIDKKGANRIARTLCGGQ